MNTATYKKAKEYVAAHRLVAVSRTIEGISRTFGYLLGCSRSFLLLHGTMDFHLDGFRILRVKDVKDIRPERVMERILRQEGVTADPAAVREIDIRSWSGLFKSLKQTGETIIVEGEAPEDDEFRIGRITQVNKSSLFLLHFDGTGKWEKKETVIPYRDITTVSWASEYVRVFSKYVR